MENNMEAIKSLEKVFITQCRQFVRAIETYSGTDPLDLWYKYLLWIEENYLIDFSVENIFDTILNKCLSEFERDDAYKQDRRLIRLYIKYINYQDQQDEHYNQLYEHEIGTLVADLYLCWALYFDCRGDFQQAERIYRLGLTAKAEPFMLLEQAHREFGVSMSQRILHRNNKDICKKIVREMEQHQKQITSLRIRGTVQQSVKLHELTQFDYMKLMRYCLPFSTGSTTDQMSATPSNKSIQSILTSSHKKTHLPMKKNLQPPPIGHRLVFDENVSVMDANRIVITPEEDMYSKGIRLSKRFKRKSVPQKVTNVPVYKDSVDGFKGTIPAYDKIMLLPAADKSYSIEEFNAYKWFKLRKIVNPFTDEQDKVWDVGYHVPFRWPPMFARKNVPQCDDVTTTKFVTDDDIFTGRCVFSFDINRLYPKNGNEENSIEELNWRKRCERILQRQNAFEESETRLLGCDNPTASIDKDNIAESSLPRYTGTIKKIPTTNLPTKEIAHTESLQRHQPLSISFKPKTSTKRKSNFANDCQSLNDTCTTQMFNYLLKIQSISTPNAKRANTVASAVHDEAKPNDKSQLEKALSPIWETSEATNADSPPNLPSPTYDHIRKCHEPMLDNSNNVILGSLNVQDIQIEDENTVQPTVGKFQKFTDVTEHEYIKDCVLSDQPKSNIETAPAASGFQFEIYQDKTQTMAEILQKANKACVALPPWSHTVVEQINDENRPITPNDSIFANNEKRSKTMINALDQLQIDPLKADRSRAKESPFDFEIFENTADFVLEETKSEVYVAGLTPSYAQRQQNSTIPASIAKDDIVSKPMQNAKSEIPIGSIADTSTNSNRSGFNFSISLIDFERNHVLKNKFLYKNENSFAHRSRFGLLPYDNAGVFKDEAEDRHNAKPSQEITHNICENIDDNDDHDENDDEGEEIGKSIYVKQPDIVFSEKEYAQWHEVTQFIDEAPETNEYQPDQVNLDETRHIIDTHLLNLMRLSPFDSELQKALLDNMGFIERLASDVDKQHISMVNIVQPLKPKISITIGTHQFRIRKMIGAGSFGKVFSGDCVKTKEMLAFKQERPPNLWEYYICREVQTRVKNNRIRDGFMKIDFALIGKNATVFASQFSKYGTLLNVCNKVKQVTDRNLDECIVMIIVKEMFALIESLHGAGIIHGDLKPDNFLLMDTLNFDHEKSKIVLQLIDFGQSIDMRQFPRHQVFYSKVKTENFICTEMMNDKPWTYQLDLFCLASTIYTLVSSKYMVVWRNRKQGPYQTQKLPRYVNNRLWKQIFDTLINIPDPKRMPNLSELSRLLDEEIASIGVKALKEKILKFNQALIQ